MAKKAAQSYMSCDKSSTCCLANILVGMGAGALLANILFSLHPIRWGIGLIAAGIFVHLLPKVVKK